MIPHAPHRLFPFHTQRTKQESELVLAPSQRRRPSFQSLKLLSFDWIGSELVSLLGSDFALLDSLVLPARSLAARGNPSRAALRGVRGAEKTGDFVPAP